MNKNNITFIISSIFCLLGIYGCSSDKNKYEVRNIYVDANIAYPSIKTCFENGYKSISDTLYNFTGEGADSIIYKFHDAKELPSSNLLNGTKKIRISLYEKRDSVGNPIYNTEHYIWDVTDWRRIFNFGETSFYSDSLINEKEMCEFLLSRLNFRYSKMLP